MYSIEEKVVISGLGIVSSIGQGRKAFTDALFRGKSNFQFMQRPGRQVPDKESDGNLSFIGSEIQKLSLPDTISLSVVRTASFSAQAILAAVHEAWHDASLSDVDPQRIGLIVGGSNFQRRDLALLYDRYKGRTRFLRPTYAMNFMDSDICGLCTEIFGPKAFAYTLGGASASGQLAFIRAAQAVMNGEADICIAVGALMDLSYWECQGFRALGAMGSDLYSDQPQKACRPFDQHRDGFIYGESCAAIVLESSRIRNGEKCYGNVAGWALAMDGNRNPDPSLDGEVQVIKSSMAMAKWRNTDVDYINPHGTGSLIGDETELESLRRCGLTHASINTTKSIVGHGLSSAGCVELVATLIQLSEGKLHPCLNLDNPISSEFDWIHETRSQPVNRALKLSMGFGGINSAVCIESNGLR